MSWPGGRGKDSLSWYELVLMFYNYVKPTSSGVKKRPLCRDKTWIEVYLSILKHALYCNWISIELLRIMFNGWFEIKRPFWTAKKPFENQTLYWTGVCGADLGHKEIIEICAVGFP